MNKVILTGFLLGVGTIAFDHLVHELPQWLAVGLYSVAVILFLVGMVKAKR